MTPLALSILTLMVTISAYEHHRHRHYWSRQHHGGYRPRIVNGEEATPYEFPYMIKILHKGQHLCGGSLISPDLVLTAAHCMEGDTTFYTLFAGEHTFEEDEGPEQARSVYSYHNHDMYGSPTGGYDISLVLVYPPFELYPETQLVPLAPPGFTPTATAVIMGWGKTGESLPYSRVLMKVTVPYVRREDCLKYYYSLPEDTLCYGGVDYKGVCKGDSGGPLMCEGLQCGVVSYGMNCDYGAPAVYVEVSKFRDWIRTTNASLFRPTP